MRVRELIDAAATGVDNGAKVEKLGAGRRGVSRFKAASSCSGSFTGEEADAAVGSEGFLVGGVALTSAAEVDEGGEGENGEGASDGGDGDGSEFFGGRFGLGGLGKDEGGYVGRERSKS